jgi:hypothetical protein
MDRHSLLMDTADLSLEFLMGRALDNAMLNTGLKDVAKGSSLTIFEAPESHTSQLVSPILGSELKM